VRRSRAVALRGNPASRARRVDAALGRADVARDRTPGSGTPVR
jgi:hypothetical protein